MTLKVTLPDSLYKKAMEVAEPAEYDRLS